VGVEEGSGEAVGEGGEVLGGGGEVAGDGVLHLEHDVAVAEQIGVQLVELGELPEGTHQGELYLGQGTQILLLGEGWHQALHHLAVDLLHHAHRPVEG